MQRVLFLSSPPSHCASLTRFLMSARVLLGLIALSVHLGTLCFQSISLSFLVSLSLSFFVFLCLFLCFVSLFPSVPFLPCL